MANKFLVKTNAKNYLSFHVVESDGFKEFLNELNPNYQLPCKKPISKVLLPQYYNSKKEELFATLKSIDTVCLTTDGWTSLTNKVI